MYQKLQKVSITVPGLVRVVEGETGFCWDFLVHMPCLQWEGGKFSVNLTCLYCWHKRNFMISRRDEILKETKSKKYLYTCICKFGIDLYVCKFFFSNSDYL